MMSAPGRSASPLRVGLLLDSLVQPAWIAAAIAEIRASDQLELALVILDGAAPTSFDGPRKKKSIFGKMRHWALSWRHAPYWAYLKLDEKLWPPSPEDLFQPVDLSEALSDIPAITVMTIRKKYSDWFPDEAVDAILEHRLDVAQRFGFRILKGRALEIARHGVWSFHHGDYLAYRGGPAGFWEVLDGSRRTGMLLQRLTEDLDDGAPIASTFSRTDLRSVALNRRHYYALGPKLLSRELNRLHRRGPPVPPRDWTCYSAPLFVDPLPPAMATLGLRLIGRSATSAVAQRFSSFNSGLSCTYRDDPSGAPHGALYRARPVPPPAGAQWRDPCAWAPGGNRTILLVEKSLGEAARIVLLPVEDKSVRAPGLPIYAETAGDVRSPAPFTWRDTPYVYVTIEGQPGIRLLRCIGWPDYWELADTILPDLPARAIALVEIDQTWWLFVGAPASIRGSPDLLYLYHAASPLGPWLPHADNPVRLGDDGVCPAGPPFFHGGSWYRPARNLTEAEGCCLAVMRIDRLGPDAYLETRTGLIKPDGRLGMAAVTCVSAIRGLTVFGTVRRAPGISWKARSPGPDL